MPCIVIRHDHEGIDFDILEMPGQSKPTLLSNLPNIRKHHDIVRDFTKQHHPILRTNRDEMRAGLRIVVIAQPDGAAMV